MGDILKRKSLKAVDNISFEIPENPAKIVTLAGESGSGKSTIAKMLLMLEEPTSGEIMYKGKSLYKMSRRETSGYRKNVQAIFQDPYSAYNPFYKVDRVLDMTIKQFNLASNSEQKKEILLQTLDDVNLSPERVLNKFPHQLSGGERQRVMVSRALLTKPRLIICDEPISMVDASLSAGILRLLLRLKEDYGASFLYITHDLSTAYQVSDEILVLYRGSVVEKGGSEMLQNPLHPYLKDLISSIPIPDPERRWKGELKIRTEELEYITGEQGCKYYQRCARRMEKCLTVTPELLSQKANHHVACHLYT